MNIQTISTAVLLRTVKGKVLGTDTAVTKHDYWLPDTEQFVRCNEYGEMQQFGDIEWEECSEMGHTAREIINGTNPEPLSVSVDTIDSVFHIRGNVYQVELIDGRTYMKSRSELLAIGYKLTDEA